MTRARRTPKTASPIDRFGDKRPERLDPADETMVVTVRLPARYVRELDRLALETGETRSTLVRRRLLDALGPLEPRPRTLLDLPDPEQETRS